MSGKRPVLLFWRRVWPVLRVWPKLLQYAGTNRIAVVGNRSAGSARADFLIGFFLLDDGDACGFGNNLDRFIEKAAKGAHGKKNDV